MGRYDLPDPTCTHKRKGIVFAGSYDGAHVSTWCCDRPACIEDAKAWATASMNLPAEFVLDAPLMQGTLL